MLNTDGSAREQLVEQLTELHRLVRLGARAAGRQGEDSSVRSYPETESSLQEMRGRLEEHAGALGRRLSDLGHTPDGRFDGADGPPENPERPSQALGGDQAFLQRLSLAYMRLRAAAQPLRDRETVELADRGYRDTQYLIRERISRAQPRAAAADHAAPTSTTPGTVS
jgi:hypothetical protein